MEYTVQKLARLAGVSARTLRYYDRIGLLKPAGTTASGYRIYGRAEVDLLQQILFYRELGFSLNRIREIVHAPEYDPLQALKEHRQQLLDSRKRLDAMIASVEKTIAAFEGRLTMTDQEKFESFKKHMVEANEQKYGAEARRQFGDEAVDRSNEKLLGMTPEAYEEVQRLEREIADALAEAMKDGDPAGPLAQKAADLHRRWLTFF